MTKGTHKTRPKAGGGREKPPHLGRTKALEKKPNPPRRERGVLFTMAPSGDHRKKSL